MLLHIRPQVDFHFTHDKVTWNGNLKIINSLELAIKCIRPTLDYSFPFLGIRKKWKKFEFPALISFFALWINFQDPQIIVPPLINYPKKGQREKYLNFVSLLSSTFCWISWNRISVSNFMARSIKIPTHWTLATSFVPVWNWDKQNHNMQSSWCRTENREHFHFQLN